MKALVYTLVDPNTNEVRYVGKSTNPQKRLNRHIRESKNNTHSHKKAWINSLLKQNQKPTLKILEKVPPNTSWEDREKYWINQFQNLTNMTKGGDGIDPGTIPWNKGTKGIMKANKGSLKPGQRLSPQTEIKKGERKSPKTEFKKGQKPPNIKKVAQCLGNGTIIETYNSHTEAAKAMNGHQGVISRAVRTNTRYKNYRWRNL